jgi:hypothetical protein
MSRHLVVVVAIVMGAGSALAGKYTGGAGRCPTLLGANVYRCTVKGDDNTSFTDCFRFATPGKTSAKFEFQSDQLGSVVGCTCNPVGGAASPSFNSSSSFTCTAAEGVSFEATVLKSGRIAKGSAANVRGTSYAFSCERDAACALP